MKTALPQPEAIKAPSRMDAPASGKKSLFQRLFQPAGLESLVLFRIAFGLLMLVEVIRYLYMGWVNSIFVAPKYHFTYTGFEWVKPWPGLGMTLHFVVLGLLATAIMVGFCYRVATVLFFLGFTYVFLLEEAIYLNHFYLVCLYSLLLIVVPAHRAWSLDAWLRPALRSTTAPAWTLWVLRAQICIVYFMGGVAKLNGDWLQGQPMRIWLHERTDFPLIGRFFEEPWMVYLFSYGGLLFDLLVTPLLLWSRTRWAAFILVAIFNLTNARLFSIGIFPWLALSTTVILFLPMSWLQRKKEAEAVTSPEPFRLTPKRRAIVSLLAVWLALQILIPLRHWLYPGNPEWTEEGHRFSWRMKLRDKVGELQLLLHEPKSGRTWEVDPLVFITQRQLDSAATRPEMILQLCHFAAGEWQAKHRRPFEVRVRSMVSLNGRPRQAMIDPNVDLSQEHRKLGPATWINPLTVPLDPRASAPPPSPSSKARQGR